jgi:hypothetical protein
MHNKPIAKILKFSSNILLIILSYSLLILWLWPMQATTNIPYVGIAFAMLVVHSIVKAYDLIDQDALLTAAGMEDSEEDLEELGFEEELTKAGQPDREAVDP